LLIMMNFPGSSSSSHQLQLADLSNSIIITQ